MPGTTTRTHTTWCQDRDHPERDCSSAATIVSGVQTWMIGTPAEAVVYVGGWVELTEPALDALIGRLTELRAQLRAQTHPVESLPAPRSAT